MPVNSRTNTDPELRFVLVTEVDQKNSTSGKVMNGFVPYEALKKTFPDSVPIREFFFDPTTINQAMVICLYTTPEGDVRRRIMRNLPMPQTDAAILEYLRVAAATVGVDVQFHSTEVGAFEEKIASSVVKEHPIFLYSLIEMFCGGVSGDPLKQLTDVKNVILRKITKDSDKGNCGHVIGDFLQGYIAKQDSLYRIAHEFGEQLSKTDLKLSSDYIPLTAKTKMLEFPFHFDFGDFTIRNAFVKIIPLTESESKSITLVCPKLRNGTWNGDLFSATIDCESVADIESAYDAMLSKFDGPVDVYKSLVTFVIKSLIYIYSEDCDITREAGARTDKVNPAKRRKFYRINNPFDIINVGFSFHGRTYSVGSTVVRGFFRWQPHGPQFRYVKLIWIDEHERKFKNSVESIGGANV